jgi:hypothetical protein
MSMHEDESVNVPHVLPEQSGLPLTASVNDDGHDWPLAGAQEHALHVGAGARMLGPSTRPTATASDAGHGDAPPSFPSKSATGPFHPAGGAPMHTVSAAGQANVTF